MRLPHFLRPPKRGSQPSNCIWVDTETLPTFDKQRRQHHRLNFGWCCYQQQRAPGEWSAPDWLRFDTIAGFWDFAVAHCRARTTLYIFAHNGGFDLPVLNAFTALPALGFTLTKAVCDAPPIILTWRKDDMTIKFIDTLNIWRMPLAKIGEAYGVAKLEMPAPTDTVEKWDEYGRRDVEIIRVAVIGWLAFLREHDLGPFAATLASQAYKTFKYRFMHDEIFIDTNPKALELSRAAYVGGRTECFRIGEFKGPFYYLDVNSMYPSVMRDNDYPTKLRAVYVMPEDDEIAEWRAEFILIGDVTIETDSPDYPVVKDKRLVFPTGTFRTTLAHAELLHAWDSGRVLHFHRVVLYDKAPIFRDYVDTLYRLRLAERESGNEPAAHNLKILMNSLYGKTGQRGRRFEECGETDPNAVWVHDEVDMDTDRIVRYRAFGGLVQAWIDDDESSESFPAIAACVTSNARMIILDAIGRAGRAHCYYTDTDSLVVDEIGYSALQSLVDPKRLGAWKLEKIVHQLTLNGPKDYVMDGERKIKGIRANAVRVAHNTWEQDRFVGFRGLLREQDLTAPIVSKVRKKLKRVYQKGKVTRSGKVTPLRLSGSRRRGRR